MTTLGRYRIEGRLGEGAMADVFRAFDPGIGRTVAIKVLKPELARDASLGRRFVREARAAGALSHPHIATIHDVGETDGVAYIAMELVDGRPLDDVLAQGRMPYERVLVLGAQLADALAYAHAAGVVHRDVKPSNILLSADGRVAKLLDFGVARIGDVDGLVRTQAGQLIGTPRYMSPEQALGRPLDHRADLFSLGAVLYEMVTGTVAFPGQGLATLALQIAEGQVEPIARSAADCPAGLRRIIDKCLAKKPDARFVDGAALHAALLRETAAVAERPARRGLSLKLKLPLVLAGVTATALAVSVPAVLARETATLEHMAVVSGGSIAAFVTGNAAVLAADNAGLPLGQQDWSALQAFVTQAARDPGVRDIAVVDTAGIVRAADDVRRIGRPYAGPAGESVVAPETFAAPDAGRGTGLRFVRSIRYAGARFGTVDLVLRRTALDAATADATAMLLALAAAMMAVAALVGWLGAAAVARPLRRLRDALDGAGASDWAVRLSHRRRDEFGAAFDAFNRAADVVEPRLRPAALDMGETLLDRVPMRRAA